MARRLSSVRAGDRHLEPDRSVHRAEDLAEHSRPTIKDSAERKCRMKGVKTQKGLSATVREELLKTLQARFEKNPNRHKGLAWAEVQTKLEANPEKLWSLNEMEIT